jgi:hypothetical protein
MNKLKYFRTKNPTIVVWAEPKVIRVLRAGPCTIPQICKLAFPTYRDGGLVEAIVFDLVRRSLVVHDGWVKTAGMRTMIFAYRPSPAKFGAPTSTAFEVEG